MSVQLRSFAIADVRRAYSIHVIIFATVMGDIKFAICLSVCPFVLVTSLKLLSGFGIWLKVCTRTEVCPAHCVSHFGDDRPRGPARGADRPMQGTSQGSCGTVNVELIERCIENLKKGKTSGLDGLMAEHVSFAHQVLIVHLSFLFSLNIVRYLMLLAVAW